MSTVVTMSITEETSRKLRGKKKFERARIPIEAYDNSETVQPKPPWMKIKVNWDDIDKVAKLKSSFRNRKLHTVCEEASCPNLTECFAHGTASFMILGDICTRRCAFCDVAHGKPFSPDEDEPLHLAQTIAEMRLKYAVITSVDRDDLKDGGALHFTKCIKEIRRLSPSTTVEILVPDFRGRQEKALEILMTEPCDVFNHNIETSPKLYRFARIGSDYQTSLNLLQKHKEMLPNIKTKSGLMVGLGESDEDVLEVIEDLRAHQVDMLTIGQYLQPSPHHLPVKRYVHPDHLEML